MRIPLVLLVLLLGFSAVVRQQTGMPEGRQLPEGWRLMEESKAAVFDHLKREARRITDATSDEMADRNTWERVRDQRRREFSEMIGLDPLPPRTPLNARITGVIDKDDYTIEKIAFESMPKIYVTANLYLPKRRTGPLPTVVYVCGHAGSTAGAKASFLQRHPITLARNGYVAMILDTVESGEVYGQHHGVMRQEMYHWYARGYNPSGVEVWNVMRALDYLETRPEVRKDRFGITGISGGSTVSWFSTALDDRLKVAVPVMGISTYAAYVADNTQKEHCDCVFPINTYQQDLMAVGGLISPRPLLMAHGRKDGLFPIVGYEEVEARLTRLYASQGVPDAFRNTVVDTGHADSAFLREHAVKWMDRWLMRIPSRPINLAFTEETPERLSVFGDTPPADAQNFRVYEILTSGPRPPAVTTLPEWQDRRALLLRQLRERVFPAFPAAAPARLEYRAGRLAVPKDFRSIEFDAEPGITLQAIYRPAAAAPAAALLYVASDGEDVDAVTDTLHGVLANRANAILIVYPRGVGEVPWGKTFWKMIMRNAVQVGRTVDSMRLWDVLRAAQVLRGEAPGAPVTTFGTGVSGTLGMYAALLDDQISQVILSAPPASHQEGPIFLNVLRFTDLPEAAALTAPRRLLFFNHMPEAYRTAERVFTLYGKRDHIRLTMNIDAAMNGRAETIH